MKQFKDGEGRTWEIRVNGDTVERIKSSLGFYLPGVFESEKTLATFTNDMVKVCKTLYVLCHNQLEKKNLTPEDFGSALYGDSLEEATQALLEELANFFPSRNAKGLLAMLAKMKKLANLMTETGMKMIEEIDVEKEAASLIATLEKKSNGSLTAAQASSEWTQAPTP